MKAEYVIYEPEQIGKFNHEGLIILMAFIIILLSLYIVIGNFYLIYLYLINVGVVAIPGSMIYFGMGINILQCIVMLLINKILSKVFKYKQVKKQ